MCYIIVMDADDFFSRRAHGRISQKQLDLRNAILTLDIVEVRRIIAEGGFDINAPVPLEEGHYSLVLTYLEMASYISYWGSNTEIFELLLFAGANPNNTVEEFEAHITTPLHHMAALGNREVVKLLVSAGANVNALNAGDRTPYEETSDLEIKKLLIAAGAKCIDTVIDEIQEHPFVSAQTRTRVQEAEERLASAIGKVKEAQEHLASKLDARDKPVITKSGSRGAIKTKAKTADSAKPSHLHATPATPATIVTVQPVQCTIHTLHQHIMKDGVDIELLHTLLSLGQGINAKDDQGTTPLQLTAKLGKSHYLKALLSQPGIDVNMTDMNGNTALHWSVINHHPNCLTILLSHPDVKVDIINHNGLCVLQNEGLNEIRGKIVLCGETGSGKSTLAEVIKCYPSTTAKVARAAKILFRSHVKPFTTGIAVHEIDCLKGKMILHDLSGNRDYFSSHCAFLEATSKNSITIFVLCINLVKDIKDVINEFNYWCGMINGVSCRSSDMCSVAVIGTHSDAQPNCLDACRCIEMVATANVNHQRLIGVFPLNLTDIHSGTVNQFMNLLYMENKSIITASPSVSPLIFVLYNFMKNNLPQDLYATTVAELTTHLRERDDTITAAVILEIDQLLQALSVSGLIFFIPGNHPTRSWIVLHKEHLLGKLDYTQLASSTGIMTQAALDNYFPEYNIEMLTQFFIQLELCRPVDVSNIDTNIRVETSYGTQQGLHLFFPSLIKEEVSSNLVLPQNSFGWCLKVSSSNKFLSARFVHVVFLRLACSFPLSKVMPTLMHCCEFHVWRNGIMWVDEDHMTTIVQLDDQFQSISVTISSPNKVSPTYTQLFHSVVHTIKVARKTFCPYLDTLELVKCPSNASSDGSEISIEITQLRDAIHQKDASVQDETGSKFATLKEWLRIEPKLPILIGIKKKRCAIQ